MPCPIRFVHRSPRGGAVPAGVLLYFVVASGFAPRKSARTGPKFTAKKEKPVKAPKAEGKKDA